MHQEPQLAPGEQYGDYTGVVFSSSSASGCLNDRLAISDCYLQPLFLAILDRAEEPNGAASPRLVTAWNGLDGWAAPGAGREPVTPQDALELSLALGAITAPDLGRHCAGCSPEEALQGARALRRFLQTHLNQEDPLFIEAV